MQNSILNQPQPCKHTQASTLLSRHSICLLVIVLFFTACSKQTSKYESVDGILDLRDTKIDSSFSVNLDGKWQFYWNQLLTPDDFKNQIQPDTSANVPNSWNHLTLNGKQLPGFGYATYRLKVLLPDDLPQLTLKFLDTGSSYRFWVNGQLYGGTGIVGTDSNTSVPSYKTALYDISPPGNSIDLIVQVANFAHNKGGLWETVKLGGYDAIHNYRDYMLIFEGFLSGSLIIMGLYHLGLFMLRRKDRSTIWFGIFCLSVAMRILVTGERILHGVLPLGYWELLVKMEYIGMNGGLPLFLLFLQSLYPSEMPKRLMYGLIIINTPLSFLDVFTPAAIYSQYVVFQQLNVLLGLILCTYVMVLAMLRRRDGATIVLLTSIVFIASVINDILYNQQIIFTFQMVGFGLFTFIFSQAFILSLKFSRAFTTVEALSEELLAYNAAYSRFVPQEFLQFLDKKSILDIRLGDQVQAEMTVLFVDIRAFTTISERMTPKENFDFLNNYLGRIGPLIRKNKGFIDKYLGDGLMALFPERAEDALQAALDIQTAINDFNKEQSQWGRPPIRVGAGIHTGRLMLGTVGEQERMDGTVISDAVNLASRIEGLTRNYGSSIVISEESLFRLDDPNRYCYRFLGKVQVKGKTEPVSVFEVFDLDPNEMRIIKQATRTEFEKGILAMHEGNFELARTLFEGIIRANPNDQASLLYIHQLDEIAKL